MPQRGEKGTLEGVSFEGLRLLFQKPRDLLVVLKDKLLLISIIVERIRVTSLQCDDWQAH